MPFSSWAEGDLRWHAVPRVEGASVSEQAARDHAHLENSSGNMAYNIESDVRRKSTFPALELICGACRGQRKPLAH